MARKTQRIKALALTKKKWVDEAGMGELLQSEQPHPLLDIVNFQVVLAMNYSLADPWFLELEFYPKLPKGEKHKRKLFPKQEVLAVLEGESRPDENAPTTSPAVRSSSVHFRTRLWCYPVRLRTLVSLNSPLIAGPVS